MNEINEVDGFDADLLYARHWRESPVVFLGGAAQLLGDHALPTPQRAAAIVESARARPDLLRESPDGRTAFVNGVEQVDDDLREAARIAAERLRWPSFGLDLSLQHGAGGGVGPHFDDGDNLVVQVSGSKTWRVGSPGDTPAAARSARMLGDPTFFPHAQPSTGVPLQLRAGDVLYLPLFAPHEGVSDGPSVSLSLGHYASSLFALVSAVLTEWEGTPEWWAPLPLSADPAPLITAVSELARTAASRPREQEG